MGKITIGDLYAYANACKSYGDFMANIAKFVGIPPTDVKCMDITLNDLCEGKQTNKSSGNCDLHDVSNALPVELELKWQCMNCGKVNNERNCDCRQ